MAAIMAETLPLIYLVRHGETEWTLTRQHTGTTDIPLTEKGESDALQVGRELQGQTFAKIFSSPRQRARRTCELAGFASSCEINNDLAEWNYGDYEGITSKEIAQKNPRWDLFKEGCPGGESPEQISARADRVVKEMLRVQGKALIFSHGHFLRVLAVRWICLPVQEAAHFLLSTSSISILGFEHSLDKPAIHLWNKQITME